MPPPICGRPTLGRALPGHGAGRRSRETRRLSRIPALTQIDQNQEAQGGGEADIRENERRWEALSAPTEAVDDSQEGVDIKW